jgi:hypothetical protein
MDCKEGERGGEEKSLLEGREYGVNEKETLQRRRRSS